MGGDDNTLISSVFIGQSDASTVFFYSPTIGLAFNVFHHKTIGWLPYIPAAINTCYCLSIAELLLERFSYPMNPEVYLLISDDEPFDINAYLLPFAIVVGICFLVMLFIYFLMLTKRF